MENKRRANSINMLNSPSFSYHARLLNGIPISLTNFQIIYSEITHRDSSKGMAIMADVYYNRENDAFIIGAENKVSFEIDIGMQVANEICERIIQEYNLHPDFLNKYHNFVGRFRQFNDGNIYSED